MVRFGEIGWVDFSALGHVYVYEQRNGKCRVENHNPPPHQFFHDFDNCSKVWLKAVNQTFGLYLDLMHKKLTKNQKRYSMPIILNQINIIDCYPNIQGRGMVE